MKYLGTHHDTGKNLPSVGNAIWLSFYLGQYDGNMGEFLAKRPCNAGEIQKDIYIDRRTYHEQLMAAKSVDMIVLCVRCLPGEINHFIDHYIRFTDKLLDYVIRKGYEKVKVELMNEPIELITSAEYIIMIKKLRNELDIYFSIYNFQLLAGAGDLHHKQHKDYYKYLRDHAFHDFDAWSIHCINDPMDELVWAHTNLGDKPIHITEFTMLDYILAYGANANYTIEVLHRFLNRVNHMSKIMSFFQVFPARISGKYESWSVYNSKYLVRLKEFYNKYIKEENMNDQEKMIKYGDKGEAVRLLQTALEKVGFNPKYIDGIFGELTLAALNVFQKEMGLSVKDYFSIHEFITMLEISETLLRTMLSIFIELNVLERR